jgi:hypothetical protein
MYFVVRTEVDPRQVVANVRRGRSGRRLIAVRTNERAAAARVGNVRVPKSPRRLLEKALELQLLDKIRLLNEGEPSVF